MANNIKLTNREARILRVLFEELRNNTKLKGNEIMWLKRELSLRLNINRNEKYYSI